MKKIDCSSIRKIHRTIVLKKKVEVEDEDEKEG